MPPRTLPGRQDHLDLIVDQWASACPELDLTPLPVIGRILRIAQHLERDIQRELSAFDLTLPEFNLLAALRRSNPPRLSPADLSRLLIISSGGIVKQIDRLERDGLVMRIPHPTDGRGLLVELTRSGRRHFDDAMGAHLRNESSLLSSVSAAERERLSAILRSLLIGLEGSVDS